ncbi:MAG TPA: DUF5357 family protein [Elainellaceae cyanobacterium]
MKDLLDKFLKSLDDIGKSIWNFLDPRQAFSWKTLISLGLFSWIAMLIIGESPLVALDSSKDDVQLSSLQHAFFILGWVFLNLGIGWGFANDAKDKKKSKIKIPLLDWEFYPGALVTAGITCFFLFRVWNPEWRAAALISWPLVTAIYTAIPKTISSIVGKKWPEPQVRQDLIISALLHIIVSCWLGFYFLVQNWIEEYPPLRSSANGLQESMFMFELDPQPKMLDLAEAVLRGRLAEIPPPEARSRFADQQFIREFINDVKRQVEQQLPASQQILELVISLPISTDLVDMPLRLQAFWQELEPNGASYYLQKECQLYPTIETTSQEPLSPAQRSNLTVIQCGTPELIANSEDNQE